MLKNIEVVEWGVLEEAVKKDRDLSNIMFPANPMNKIEAEWLLEEELKKHPWKTEARTTETGVSIKALRVVKKVTTVIYE